ncbi:MAG: reprolysin-like metallopeptidase, partial [Chitinophagales bacterium]
MSSQAKSKLVRIDLPSLQEELSLAVLETFLDPVPSVIIDIPMPHNCTVPFEVVESPIMDAKFAKAYPFIKTYSIVSIENKTTYGRLTSSHLGIHATIFSLDGTITIFPVQNSSDKTSHYINQNGYRTMEACGMEEELTAEDWKAHHKRQLQLKLQKSFGYTSGDEVHTYRLATIATGEFHEVNLDATNGSANDDDDVLAVITSIVNGIQVFFDRDVAVRFNLLTPVLYDDHTTDPFTPDTDAGADSRTLQARKQIDASFDVGDYDIGHIFHNTSTVAGWSSGGVAGLGVVCDDFVFDGGPQKARGWSGSSDNQTDSFIGLAAHEFGHQFDAAHTFNGTGGSCSSNISSSDSYEIGSGVTIMAYVGICSAAQNIPISGTAHDYFHTHSLTQIINYINVSGSCVAAVANANTPPTVDADVCGGTYTIPVSTPFELIGTGSDADGDAVTYTWEQYDEDGAGVTPTQGDIGADAADNTDTNPTPLFRNYPPSTSSSRTIPVITDLIDNVSSDFEVLPTVSRTINFRLTARDNNPNGGGVACDALVVNVDDVGGPFAVTAPNDGTESWTAGSPETVTWNVAGTTSAPISCATVDIRLSIDGGLTYPYTLESGTSNDGTESVDIPSGVPDVSTARIRVECASNTCVRFFDISNDDFDISSSCQSASNYICSTDAVAADEGDGSLDLGLSFEYGTVTISETRNIDGTDPIVSRGIADSQGSATCTAVGTRA